MSDNKLSLIVSFVGQDKLSGAIKNIIGLGKSGDQVLRGMFRQARDLKGQMADVRYEIAKGTGNVTALIDKEKQLAAALAKVNDQIDRQKGLNSFAADTRRIAARGGSLQDSGASNVAGGLALAAPLVLATKGAMDFSSGMVDIQQKAALTNAETDRMAGNILAAAKATHQMPEDLRGAVDMLAGFGMDPRQAQQMVSPIGRAATAYKAEIGDLAATSNANFANLKVPIEQTGAALDIMAAGGKAGAFEIKDMARFFPSLTAQMQGLGQSGLGAISDLTAALQIARRGAGTSEEAANNIENLLAKINAKGTIDAFKKNFGVDLPAALKRAAAEGKSPLEAIAAITQKATGGDLSKLSFAFEDMQAQSAVRALILNLKDYRDIRDQIGRSGGTVDADFAMREARDGSVNVKSMLGALQTLGIVVGTKLLPLLTPAIQHLAAGAEAVSSWAQANPQLAQTLVTIVAAFVAGKVALGAFQFTFGGALKLIASSRTIFTTASTAFGVLRTAAIFLGKGVARAGAMMLANPMVLAITAIVVAIGVAAYLIYANWDKIKAAFAQGKAWVMGVLQSMPGQLRSIGSMMMQGLLAAIDPFGLGKKLVIMAQNGIAQFKAFLGIKSPSRLMMEMGGHVAGGLALGLDRHGARPVRAMGRMAAAVAGAGAIGLSAPALAAPAAGGAGGGSPITIHIHQLPGEDANALADRVARLLEQRQGSARRRGLTADF
ncbi:phage tail tape measure protein [Novosphingobium huizhouense]|uniref:phage tail tape measure protein n=1 Tax=Novosphingobium huizhouense TaxID=2866625 RepID=UPI001CD88978|nr:phage tail tape measure protein [Novosphingobium huizhouense]